MARTVKVVLEAVVGQYKRGIGEAEKATERLADAIDDVDGKGFDKTAGSAKKLAVSTAGAGAAADKAADDFDEATRHARKLEEQIRETEAAVRSLAKGFANTGDTKLLKEIREQQKMLAELRNVQKQLADPAASQQAGAAIAVQVGVGFQSHAKKTLPTSLRNALQSASWKQVGAVGVGAALAPTIGALIAAAVVGGAGVGGIVGGIALAARSPLIADRAKTLGKMVSSNLQLEAIQAFNGPLQGSLDEMERLAQRSLPKIGQIFESVAPSVERLTMSIGRAADGLLDGLVDAAEKSAPVLDELGNLIGDTGESVGQLFSDVATHSEAAASGIRDVNEALQDVITVAGALIQVLLIIKEVDDALDSWADSGSILGTVFKSLKDSLYGPLKPMAELIKGVRDMAGSGGDADQQIRRLTGTMAAASSAAENLAATEDDVKQAQDAAKQAQDEYNRSLADLNPTAARSKQVLDGLKTATDALYGSQIQATEANEAWQASWDNLAGSVKENKLSLDLHTAAGRANRDAIEDLLTKSNEMYAADIAAGMATDQATKKHQARTQAVEKEANRLGLNKKITGELIDTYGQIPPKKTTDLVVQGVNAVADRLYELSVMQYALAKGIPIASARAALKGERGPQRAGGGYAAGGQFNGQLPGAPSAVDNLLGMGPQGQVFGLAGGEYVVNAEQTQKHLPLLEAINAGADGYAAGGYFPAQDRSTRWPFVVTASNSKIMSEAQAKAKVTPAGPSGGQTSDWIVQVVHAAFPGMQVLSKDRPGARTLTGNVSYHARGRAVDFPASKPLAEWVNANYFARTRELITPWQSLNIQNGRRHSYSPIVYNQHNFAGGNAHDHWAMANGGIIPEPVFGVGASGRTYSFGERGPERVIPHGYAGGGLVNVAPSTASSTGSTRTGTHLDYVEAYLSAKDAIASLTATLKANKKAWSTATAAGRDNRQALISTIRAAQQAAEAKYNETGSVKAANKVYADYLKQLDRTLKAMGLNAKQRKALIKAYGEKPDYNLPETPAKSPSNSSARVKSVQDYAAAEEALSTAKAAFAWTKPSFAAKTETGRAELNTLFSFLSAAEQAAQSQYQETGNAKSATALYNGYIAQLRTILTKSGMTKAEIDRLLQQYGRITLSKNATGGLYEHAATGKLRDAHIASGARTLYAYAEPQTGGELFAPKYGNLAKTKQNVTRAVTQWWGGRDPWGGSGGRPITVQATIPITLGSEVIKHQVEMVVDAAVGKVVAATVYQTA